MKGMTWKPRSSLGTVVGILGLIVGLVGLPAAIWGTPLRDWVFGKPTRFEDRSSELGRLRREWHLAFDANFTTEGEERVFESPNGVGKLLVRGDSLLINIRDVKTGTMYHLPVSPSFSAHFLAETTTTKLVGPPTGACGLIFDYRKLEVAKGRRQECEGDREREQRPSPPCSYGREDCGGNRLG
jgi:hypothetical protein